MVFTLQTMIPNHSSTTSSGFYSRKEGIIHMSLIVLISHEDPILILMSLENGEVQAKLYNSSQSKATRVR